MLENVSWGVFLKLLGIVLTCYYGYVFIRYFRSDVSNFLVKGNRMGVAGMFSNNTNETERSSMDKLEVLLTEIDSELLANATNPGELIEILRQKIHHHGLPDSNVGRKILKNHLLLFIKSGQVDLTDEDLMSLFSEFPI